MFASSTTVAKLYVGDPSERTRMKSSSDPTGKVVSPRIASTNVTSSRSSGTARRQTCSSPRSNLAAIHRDGERTPSCRWRFARRRCEGGRSGSAQNAGAPDPFSGLLVLVGQCNCAGHILPLSGCPWAIARLSGLTLTLLM
jgi:hypothetical protein